MDLFWRPGLLALSRLGSFNDGVWRQRSLAESDLQAPGMFSGKSDEMLQLLAGKIRTESSKYYIGRQRHGCQPHETVEIDLKHQDLGYAHVPTLQRSTRTA